MSATKSVKAVKKTTHYKIGSHSIEIVFDDGGLVADVTLDGCVYLDRADAESLLEILGDEFDG